jgi:hypothetical protein
VPTHGGLDVRPVLTVMLTQGEQNVRAHGVCADETIFRDACFLDLNDALRYFQSKYNSVYKVVLNIPPTVKR